MTQGAEKLPIQKRAGSSGDGMCETAAPNHAPTQRRDQEKGKAADHRERKH